VTPPSNAAPDGGGDDATTTAPDARGDDASPPAMETIGAAGGALAASGVTLTVPPGALASATAITITPSAGPIPSGYAAVSPLYTFGPDGTTFLQPVTIAFTLPNPGANPTVFWSNATGGYDAQSTTSTATGVSSAIMHFSSGFVGRLDAVATHDAGVILEDAASDAAIDTPPGDAAAADAGPPPDSNDAGPDSAALDASIDGITAVVDGVATVFAASPSVAYTNGVSTIQANDSASSTHWQLQLVVLFNQQVETCSQTRYPSISYTHFTSGVEDETFSTIGTAGSCSFAITHTATTAGQQASGTFSGSVVQSVDAGGGSHSLEGGVYDVTM
jgi:hypothetical protein